MKTYRKANDSLCILHPECGGITISRVHTLPGRHDHPDGRPWFCAGRYYPTALRAVKDFLRRWRDPQPAADDSTGAHYQAGYAYACGYYD